MAEAGLWAGLDQTDSAHIVLQFAANWAEKSLFRSALGERLS